VVERACAVKPGNSDAMSTGRGGVVLTTSR
jgi:hypothetical protein